MAWSVSRSAAGSRALVVFGLTALALLVISLVAGWAGGIGWSVALLGAEYLLQIFSGGSLDIPAPLVAVGFFLIAELGWWSWELTVPSVDELAIYVHRALLIGFVALVSLVLGTALLAVAPLSTYAGLPTQAIGTAAMVTLFALVAVLALRNSNALATIRPKRPLSTERTTDDR